MHVIIVVIADWPKPTRFSCTFFLWLSLSSTSSTGHSGQTMSPARGGSKQTNPCLIKQEYKLKGIFLSCRRSYFPFILRFLSIWFRSLFLQQIWKYIMDMICLTLFNLSKFAWYIRYFFTFCHQDSSLEYFGRFLLSKLQY